MLDKLDIEKLKEIAHLAGEEVLDVYGSDFAVDEKEDESPLTEADRRANTVILQELEKAYPDVPYVSEEVKVGRLFVFSKVADSLARAIGARIDIGPEPEHRQPQIAHREQRFIDLVQRLFTFGRNRML